MVVSLLLSLLVGIVLGIIGAGDGILAIPTLVIGIGWAPQQVTPMALVAVAGSAALGAIDVWHNGLVRHRAVIVMTLAGMPITSVGLWAAQRSSPILLILLFTRVMLTIACRLVRVPEMAAAHAHPVTLDEHAGRLVWAVNIWLLFLTVRVAPGFMTGLLAMGGGFIIVPLLRQFTPLPIHSCTATPLMIVVSVGMSGVAAAVMQGTTLPMPFTFWFVLNVVTGMLVGWRLNRHLPEHIVQKGSVGLLVVVALGMVLNAAIMKSIS